MVGESDGHDVVVDSLTDEEFVVQNGVLDFELERDRAKDIQIEVTGCPGLEPGGGVDWFVLEAVIVGVF